MNTAIKNIKGFKTDMLCKPWYYGSAPLHIPNNTDFTTTPDHGHMVIKDGCIPISAADPRSRRFARSSSRIPIWRSRRRDRKVAGNQVERGRPRFQMPSWEDFKPFIVTGLALGGVYALSGVGMVVLYRATGVLNLAFGAVGAMGALIAWQLINHNGWSRGRPTSCASLFGGRGDAGLRRALRPAAGRP